MASIRVLPADLANKIAAGEVVERPASVVKELLENALDAGAGTVAVTLQDGGRRLIQVEDDGSGMTPEDARLCLERHATSKIREVPDLFHITTLGFRGEALPSIASVSRLTLVTAPRDGGEGTKQVVDGGRLVGSGPAAATAGTTITVEDLFFNTPARRKFLRSPETEMGHIVRVVTSYALAFPRVAFALRHGGRTILDVRPAGDLASRCREALPREMTRGATVFARDEPSISLEGFLPPLSPQRAGRDHQYLFINRRLVRDRVLSHAVSTAYEDLVPKGRHPSLVLFVGLDPSRVDVNVHPTKAEVRFQDSRAVHVTVAASLRRAYGDRGEVAPMPASAVLPLPEATASPGAWPAASSAPRLTWTAVEARESAGGEGPAPSARPGPLCPRAGSDEADEPPAHDLPRIIGQLRRTFIVATDAAGLLLVDQHVAHERILYEKAFRGLAGDGGPRQPLLVPELLDLPEDRAALLRANREGIEGLGFRFDDFGQGGFAIRELPSFLSGEPAAPLLAEILDDLLAGGEARRSVDAARHHLAASLACRAAVKARAGLSREAQERLVADLWRCENRYHCPHGRPILMRLGYDQIARHFERR